MEQCGDDRCAIDYLDDFISQLRFVSYYDVNLDYVQKYMTYWFMKYWDEILARNIVVDIPDPMYLEYSDTLKRSVCVIITSLVREKCEMSALDVLKSVLGSLKAEWVCSNCNLRYSDLAWT